MSYICIFIFLNFFNLIWLFCSVFSQTKIDIYLANDDDTKLFLKLIPQLLRLGLIKNLTVYWLEMICMIVTFCIAFALFCFPLLPSCV